MVIVNVVCELYLFWQGHEIEMEDMEHTGFRFTGTLQGTMIACHCGCERTLPGAASFVYSWNG